MAWIATEKGTGRVIVQAAISKKEARAAAEALRLLGGPEYEIKEVVRGLEDLPQRTKGEER